MHIYIYTYIHIYIYIYIYIYTHTHLPIYLLNLYLLRLSCHLFGTQPFSRRAPRHLWFVDNRPRARDSVEGGECLESVGLSGRGTSQHQRLCGSQRVNRRAPIYIHIYIYIYIYKYVHMYIYTVRWAQQARRMQASASVWVTLAARVNLVRYRYRCI